MKLLFWILLGIVLYTYFGYTLLLIILNTIKSIPGWFAGEKHTYTNAYPEVTLLIAAYNEKEVVDKKMENSLSIDYPRDKLKILWITDGSDDGTYEKLKTYNGIILLHETERKGKTAALNRAMKHVNTPFTVFCDANTMLARNSIAELMSHFRSENIGCVAGEKRIARNLSEAAAGVGESTYWQYESFIKKLESNLDTTLGAAGELYAIRTELYEELNPNLIIDDFVNSLNIARKGYKIKYAPKAYATESPSANSREELKRKIRIAAGGFQTMAFIPSLLNVFRYGILSIEFISHKVFRWLFVPFSIPLILFINIYICYAGSWNSFEFNLLLLLQGIFYLVVIAGGILEKRSIRLKIVFLPYYLIFMNFAQIVGFFR
ncbi:MAG: glycosyltransferase family 2 protein, partial [Bacteroidales bacterium]